MRRNAASLTDVHGRSYYPAQEAAIAGATRYAIIEASTKAGKTHGCIKWLFQEACLNPGANYWWVAPVIAQARIAFRRYMRALKRGTFKVNRSELTIELANGSVIWFKGADNPDTLYGDDVRAAVIDEATRCKEEAWHAVRSTLTATRGRLRLIGNVKGRRNWAYQLARKAESGEPDWHYAKLTAYDAVKAGILAAEEIEDAQRVLPEHIFKELYLAEASDDGGNPFDLRSIAACTGELSDQEVVAWGVDLGKKVDYTVCIGLDRFGAVCQFERWIKIPWKDSVQRITNLIVRSPALVDSTGVGDPILEAVQERCPQVEGFTFSAPSKQQLMEGLALEIQSKGITFPEGPIRSELEAFEYEYTRTGVRYAAPEGMHDDCVMALGLAVKHYRAFHHGGSDSSDFGFML